MSAHKSLKRIFYRSLEEIKATIEIAKTTSIRGAISTFLSKLDIQRMNSNGYRETPASENRLLKKHEVMLKYFETKFAVFMQGYDYDRPLPDDDFSLHDHIWVCWWQGLENAPTLVDVCIASIQRNAGQCPVTIITEENYVEYVSIPGWVVKKYKDGKISRTHFSDVLRLSLLAEHGGLWLDATFFCRSFNMEYYSNLPLWTIKRPGYSHISVADGQFATYSLGCTYENRWVFATIRDFLLNYWETHDYLIDYLMLDYLFVLAQRADKRIGEMFQRIEPNNPRCDDLESVLGEVYEESVWGNIKKETFLYKLTWKKNYHQQKNGSDTFFAKLLDGTIR